MKKLVIGDTPQYAWLLELLNRGFLESGEKISADATFIMSMCKSEPEYAQFAMQWLAQDLRKIRNQGSPSERREKETNCCFRLGVLCLAYTSLAVAEGRIKENELPPELETIVKIFPEIIECENKLGPIKSNLEES